MLAILVSLMVAVWVGYDYWRTRQVEAARGAELSAARNVELAKLRRDLAEQARFHGADLATLEQKLAAQLLALSELRAAVEVAAADRPASAPQWRLLEAEHLLQLANQQLLLMRDAAGARHLLVAADEILAASELAASDEVRVLLAGELASLGDFKGVDVETVLGRLDAVENILAELPLRFPEYIAAGDDQLASPADASMLDALAKRLNGLVRLRRHDGESSPELLAPAQLQALRQHPRLLLESARIATLRRDQAVFQASLGEARDWLRQFTDSDSEATVEALRELEALLTVELATPLPDISGALASLRDLRRRLESAARQ